MPRLHAKLCRTPLPLSTGLAATLLPFALLLLLLSLPLPLVCGQEAPPLAQLITAAKERFIPVTAADAAQAKANLAYHAARLEASLLVSPPDVREGWRETLGSSDLEAQLASDTPDLEVLNKVLARYQTDKKRMEWHMVQSTRAALRQYIHVLTHARDEKLKESYHGQLDELQQKVAAFTSSSDQADALAIGRSLGWLRRAGQAAEVVEAIDRSYSRPNLMLTASRSLMSIGVEQNVAETMAVREKMLGVDIQGTVFTSARASLGLIPDAERASFQLLLNGQANSNNTGSKGPVKVLSTGVTSIQASKVLWLDDQGLHGAPATAACATASSIDDIQAKCNAIKKFAAKKAEKTKPQAEQIASRSAEQRVAARVDAQAADVLNKANESLVDRFRNPLLRRGGLPRSMRFSTTEEELRAVITQVGDANIAAPSDAPAVSGSPDVALRLHQSFVGNFSEALIGGVTLTDVRLVEMLEEAKREVPEELKISDDKDPWSITFAAEQPISVTFKDGTLAIAIHGRKFTRSEQEIRSPMRIIGTYALEKTPTGTQLVRRGDVEVEYVGVKGRESVTQVAFKTFVRRKFEALFKSPLPIDIEKLPERWETAGKLAVVESAAQNGWLSLAWKMQPSVSATTAQVEHRANP